MNAIKEASLILNHDVEREHPFETGYADKMMKCHSRGRHKLRWSQPQDGWGQSVPEGSKCAKFLKWGLECPDQSDVRGAGQEKW